MFPRLIAALTLWISALAAQAEVLVVNSPGDGYLNLRTGPGSEFAIITRMYHGSTVNTLEYAGGWARVEHESGAVGWAFRKYMVRPAATPARFYIYSPGDGFLNLRTGPGTRFDVVVRMYNGEWVEVLERSGNWVRVYHQGGFEGWAFSQYLRR